MSRMVPIVRLYSANFPQEAACAFTEPEREPWSYHAGLKPRFFFFLVGLSHLCTLLLALPKVTKAGMLLTQLNTGSW